MAINLTKPPGEIITFYSYKGGTGRSMALANVACLLAKRSRKKVLMIDWDLEAPGLHWYFREREKPNSADAKTYEKELKEAPGLIDLFLSISEIFTQPRFNSDDEAAVEAVVRKLSLQPYTLKTHVPYLYLLKAGRFDEQYSQRINSFNWIEFYERSPSFFRFFSERLKQHYQYVLIDSRTGVTDTSGICTALMPEKLVTVFTPNRQSLDGVLDLASNAAAYRKQSDDLRPLTIFPLPSRVEASETTLRQHWRFGTRQDSFLGYQTAFEQLFQRIYNLPQCNLGNYFDEVQIQHFPRYSYGEEIAVLEENEGDRLSIARSYESLTTQMLSFTPPWEYKPNRRVRAVVLPLPPIIEQRYEDLKATVAQLKESIDALQTDLEKIQASSLARERVNARGFKIISQLIIKLNDSVVEIQTAIKEYRSQLEETILNSEEVIREHENIGEQIIKISNFTKMIRRIQVDLPGFIQRSS
jgi:MinD-like ATPase involved in chromosome partitioning or flagellar assembly